MSTCIGCRTRTMVAAMFAGLFAVAGRAAVINVPADHPTIQAAINFAHTGDTVLVAPGTYNEAVNFNGKALSLKSTGGSKATIIDATGFDTSVIAILTNPQSLPSSIDGFTITGGVGTETSEGFRRGGGVYVQGGSVSIRNCSIIDNSASGATDPPSPSTGGFGGGVSATGTFFSMHDCLVADNFTQGACSGGNGGGCYLGSDTVEVVGCVVANNGAVGGTCTGTGSARGGGLYLIADTCIIVNSIIDDNAVSAAGTVGAGLYNFNTSNATLVNCSVSKNHATSVAQGADRPRQASFQADS